jgi:broad specificity phosphatase PhoE
MTQRTLYFIEHAEYESGVHATDGRGGGLTALGREQAARTADRLQALPISMIHHSPLQRAVETASIIAARFPTVPLRQSPLLRECFPSIPPVWNARYAHISTAQRVRDRRQAQRAFIAFCRPCPGVARYELVVCHANLIRSIVCRAVQAPLDTWIYIDVFHCGISVIAVDASGQITLVAHNDTGHLPDAFDSHLEM